MPVSKTSCDSLLSFESERKTGPNYRAGTQTRFSGPRLVSGRQEWGSPRGTTLHSRAEGRGGTRQQKHADGRFSRAAEGARFGEQAARGPISTKFMAEVHERI